jgi:hypothetical protein
MAKEGAEGGVKTPRVRSYIPQYMVLGFSLEGN